MIVGVVPRLRYSRCGWKMSWKGRSGSHMLSPFGIVVLPCGVSLVVLLSRVGLCCFWVAIVLSCHLSAVLPRFVFGKCLYGGTFVCFTCLARRFV